MIIHIDSDSGEAIYMQLHNQIIMGIARSELEEGDSLPSVRGMAEKLGVNMHTVHKAYAMLRDEGYLTMDKANGAVVHVDVGQHPARTMEKAMKMLIAESICRDMSEEDLHSAIEKLYKEFR